MHISAKMDRPYYEQHISQTVNAFPVVLNIEYKWLVSARSVPKIIRPCISAIKCLYIRGNIISRKFANCSLNVKFVVFKTYCACLYTSQVWSTCLSRTMNRLKVAYNDWLRMVLGIPRYCSASEMFAYTNVPSCQCGIRLNMYSFMKRIQCMKNEIVGPT